MHSKIVSSCENENLKIYEGRVLTLLGDIVNKLDRLLSLVEDEVPTDSQEEYNPEQDSNGEWSDG